MLRKRPPSFNASNASKGLQRTVAGLLLLLFVWDAAFHLSAQSYPVPDARGAGVLWFGAGDSGSHEGHPNCGFPDHGCALSHHHHFPAFLTTAHFALPYAVFHRDERALLLAALQSPQAARQIRAPPSFPAI